MSLYKLFPLLVLLFCLQAWAIPMQLPFQGKLRNARIQDVNRSIPFTFCLYDAPAGGNCYWKVTKTLDVNAVDGTDYNVGVFFTLLGEGGDPILDVNNQNDMNYIGVTVQKNTEMAPRIELGSTPYAFMSLYAGSVSGSVYADVWVAVDGNVGTSDWIEQAVLDANQHRFWESAFDGNWSSAWYIFAADDNISRFFHQNFKTAFDLNAEADMFVGSCDNNGNCVLISSTGIISADGLSSVYDLNVMHDLNVVGDANVGGDLNVAGDINALNIQADSFYGTYYGDGGALTGITGAADGWIYQSVLDANQHRFWETAFDGNWSAAWYIFAADDNISRFFHQNFKTAFDLNAEADMFVGSCDGNADCTIATTVAITSADGLSSVYDLNVMNDLNVVRDANVGRDLNVAGDINALNIQADAFYGTYYGDGSSLTGVATSQDFYPFASGAGLAFDGNWLRVSELGYFDTNFFSLFNSFFDLNFNRKNINDLNSQSVLNDLSDVTIVGVPDNNTVLKWNGMWWEPAVDADKGQHVREHAMESVDDHYADYTWSVFYSDNAGDIQSLALGNADEYLKSTGAASAPEFDTPTVASDGWIEQGILDANQHRFWESAFDGNWSAAWYIFTADNNIARYFNQNFKVAFDLNAEADMFVGSCDGNADCTIATTAAITSADGLSSVYDLNVMHDLNVVGDMNVGGDLNATDINAQNIQADVFYGTYLGDGSGLTGVTGTGDGWIEQGILDANQHAFWEAVFDGNFYDVFQSVFDTNFLRAFERDFDGNFMRLWESTWDSNATADLNRGSCDGNADCTLISYAAIISADGLTGVYDLNVMHDLNVVGDANVGGDLNVAGDINALNIQADAFYGTYYGDGSELTGVTGTGDGWIYQSVLDANQHRFWETAFDGNWSAAWYIFAADDNISRFFHQNFKVAFDLNAEADMFVGNCDGNADCTIATTAAITSADGLSSVWDLNVMNDLNVVGDANVGGDLNVAGDINALNIQANVFYGGEFIGDGSGLTGVSATSDGFCDQNADCVFIGDVNISSGLSNFADLNVTGDANVLGDVNAGGTLRSTNGQLCNSTTCYDIADLNRVTEITATAGTLELFFFHQDSIVPDYNVMDTNIFFGAASTYQETITANDQILISFFYNNDDVNRIDNGVSECHMHAYKTAGGTKDVRLYCELYERNNAGDESLIFTTENSEILPLASIALEPHAVHNTIAIDGNYLVVKIRADLSGAGGDPIVAFVMQGEHYSHLGIPVSAILVHNDLLGIQGGTAGEYYHLTAAEQSALSSLDESDLNRGSCDNNADCTIATTAAITSADGLSSVYDLNVMHDLNVVGDMNVGGDFNAIDINAQNIQADIFYGTYYGVGSNLTGIATSQDFYPFASGAGLAYDGNWMRLFNTHWDTNRTSDLNVGSCDQNSSCKLDPASYSQCDSNGDCTLISAVGIISADGLSGFYDLNVMNDLNVVGDMNVGGDFNAIDINAQNIQADVFYGTYYGVGDNLTGIATSQDFYPFASGDGLAYDGNWMRLFNTHWDTNRTPDLNVGSCDNNADCTIATTAAITSADGLSSVWDLNVMHDLNVVGDANVGGDFNAVDINAQNIQADVFYGTYYGVGSNLTGIATSQDFYPFATGAGKAYDGNWMALFNTHWDTNNTADLNVGSCDQNSSCKLDPASYSQCDNNTSCTYTGSVVTTNDVNILEQANIYDLNIGGTVTSDDLNVNIDSNVLVSENYSLRWGPGGSCYLMWTGEAGRIGCE